MKERCKETVFSSGMAFLRPKPCSRHAQKDGFCTQHHPDSVAERSRKADERFREQQEKSPWRRIERMQAIHKELVEALEGVIAISDRKHGAWDRAKAVIAKAKGVK